MCKHAFEEHLIGIWQKCCRFQFKKSSKNLLHRSLMVRFTFYNLRTLDIFTYSHEITTGCTTAHQWLRQTSMKLLHSILRKSVLKFTNEIERLNWISYSVVWAPSKLGIYFQKSFRLTCISRFFDESIVRASKESRDVRKPIFEGFKGQSASF